MRPLSMSLALVLACLACAGDDRPVARVGSKKFTESVLLGEMARMLAAHAGARVVHAREVGGTRVLWDALVAGEIDAYPEYTGTIVEEILAGENLQAGGDWRGALQRRGIVAGRPLGFNNTYAIGMAEARAKELGIRTIGDLAAHPELRFGMTSEFMDRADGWPGLARRYGLAPAEVRGLDHDLAYRGIGAGTIDVTDLYSTDADIEFHHLRVLTDDRHYFPEYQALFLYRRQFAERQPTLVAAIERLAGKLDERAMRRLNAEVKIDGRSESAVAASFLEHALAVRVRVQDESMGARLLARTIEHLALTGSSLLCAIAIALPLGIAAARRRALGQLILGATGILQTIPSLALLVFMIPLFGIGTAPAVAALFLYSLLPIVRNTHAGLVGIDRGLLESAQVLGLPSGARLRRVELPLATPAILAGIKTAAVINVGTATLGALIGAGGYGQPILTGIRLSDDALILEGAIPAAALAILCQWAFDLAERRLVPRGLRI